MRENPRHSYYLDMGFIINAREALRALSLAAACLVATGCATDGGPLDDPPEAPALPLQQGAADAGIAADDLLPADRNPSFAANFTTFMACQLGGGVLDHFGGPALLSWPGQLLTVTSDKPADRIPCQTRIQVGGTPGLQAAVIRVAHRGSLRLAAGSRLAMTTYFNTPDARVDAITLVETGPSQRNFEEERQIPAARRAWSACGGPLAVEVTQWAGIGEGDPSHPVSELRLPGDAGESAYTVELGFRRCTPPG